MDKKEVLLKTATRDELIEELKQRVSITHMLVNKGNGASINTMSGSVAVTGKSHIFVIEPEQAEPEQRK